MTPPAEALARTHARAFTDQRPWSAEEFAQLLETAGVILCGDATSFILGRVIADEAEVLTVATDPQYRREGRARVCLDAFLTQVTAQGAKQVFLEVSDQNIAAKSLYLNAGFSEVGRRRGYYTHPDGAKSDALAMRQMLSHQAQLKD